MEIYARQGDLVIEKLPSKAPGDFEKKKNFVFAGDSSGHPHVLKGTALVQRIQRVTRVRIIEPMELEHGKSGGHNTVSLTTGDYEIRPLRERGDGSDRAVED